MVLRSSAVPGIKSEPKPELCVVGIVHIALLETSKQTEQCVVCTGQQALSGTSAQGKLGRVSVAWNSETTQAVCCSHSSASAARNLNANSAYPTTKCCPYSSASVMWNFQANWAESALRGTLRQPRLCVVRIVQLTSPET